jgi:drug/metabolite transporter (DMT)-like permease
MLGLNTIVGFATMVACTVAANLMLKVGAEVPASDRIVFGILGWKSVAGLALFGIGGLVYSVVLRSVPLNIAQAFTSSQYVGVVLAASFILREPISPTRWIGLGCICFGILLVSASART